MTETPLRVLVIGGGFSGLAAAIALRQRGYAVDLVEIDSQWTTYGAGISIGGATLRAFRTLGVLDNYLAEGSATDNTELRAPDGTPLATIPTPRIARPDVPGCGGVMRPVLARILADAALATGTAVRLGCTFSAIHIGDDHVDVTFTDGTQGRYDLVVGADGLRSAVRRLVIPDAPQPRYTGQGVWRAVLSRPADIDRTILWVGTQTKVGVNPVSADEMYLFVNENRPVNERVAEIELLPRLKALLEPFSAPEVVTIREALGAHSGILYRPIEALLVPQPWYRGRVVLIGDAVHATTPHLASGAGIGIEDAIVLAEEVDAQESIEAALAAFQTRRWERCRMVVENSGRLGEIETQGGDKAQHGAIMRASFAALAAEI